MRQEKGTSLVRTEQSPRAALRVRTMSSGITPRKYRVPHPLLQFLYQTAEVSPAWVGNLFRNLPVEGSKDGSKDATTWTDDNTDDNSDAREKPRYTGPKVGLAPPPQQSGYPTAVPHFAKIQFS